MKQSAQKILVTGGTGFVGVPVVQELLARGYEVHLSVQSPYDGIKQEGLLAHELNLLDLAKVQAFLQKNSFDGVIHLAWFSATGENAMLANENMDWTIATLNLLKTYAEQGGGKFLGAGSVSEYDYDYGYLSESLTPTNSPFLYGQCKSSIYNIGQLYAEQNALDFKWARIFNLYGPNEKKSRLVPAVILGILQNEGVQVSDCLKFQDYLHVFDAARAVVDFFESDVEGAVNICSGEPVQLRTIVKDIAAQMGFHDEIPWGSVPAYFENPLLVGDNARLKNEIGWSQKIALDVGLQMTIDWWKENQNV